MSTNLVLEAAKRTLEIPSADNEQCDRLMEVRSSMLPAEAAARAELDTRIAELERRRRGEEKGHRLALEILSPEIFTWKKDQLPAFAVFDVAGDGECIISSDPGKQKLPACCRAYYQNAIPLPLSNRLQRFFTQNFKSIWCLAALLVEVCYFYSAQASAAATWGKFALGLGLGILASFCASLMFLILVIVGWILFVREGEKTAAAKFAGAIPLPVKEKIRQYQSEFEQLIIVAEAKWNVLSTRKAIAVPPCCDPLVVGWDGDFFWVIDRFDTSSIEQLASDEFAVKPDGLSLHSARV